MKKTLSTAMLCLGIASMAQAALTLPDDFKLENAVINEQAYAGTTTFTSEDGFSATGNPYNTSSDSTRNNMTVIIVFDAEKLAALSDLTSQNIIKAASWGVGFTDSQTFKGWWNNGFYSNGPTTSGNLSDYAVDGLITMTIVTGWVTDNAQGSRIYLEDSNTYWSNTASNGASTLSFAGADINTITLNSEFADAITQFYVFDTALSQTQVADVYSMVAEVAAGTYTPAAIPEPATATLSLLALAGLAARRRRK